MKPIIGITSYIRKDSFRNYSQVGYEYIDKIEKAGGIPMIIPILIQYGNDELNKIVDGIDGIIFTGGCNVDPLWYGEESKEKIKEEDKLRNNFEKDIFMVVKKKEKPILGVCRGCQLINVLQNGTLIQNIDKELDTLIDHTGTGKKVYEKKHIVAINEDSMCNCIYKKSCVKVNSFHEQCIKQLGYNLKIVARSIEDGIPEAIEYDGDNFMMGVQWHPEALEDQLELFKSFINICSK